ncbi:hypothetical protein LIER_13908 [Lithospermum erythrorhizon]|uniref:DC1 domain-containing protein n=1 Tax=Lithospermum erythrorhizon TaxID=34254 RepID=A0AAV3PX41_LITER
MSATVQKLTPMGFAKPLILSNPLHPEHEVLQLFPKDPYEAGTAYCRVCEKLMKGFVYDCSECNGFYMDFKCAFPKPEKSIQNIEQLHSHQLIFQAKPAKFSCNLCSSEGGNGDEEDQSYSCSACDYWIHKSCAYTKLVQRYKNHEHSRSLVQGVPEDLQICGIYNCDVCRNAVSPKDLVSHCASCRTFVHVRCMVTDDTSLITSIN